jgi:hypothetical protein
MLGTNTLAAEVTHISNHVCLKTNRYAHNYWTRTSHKQVIQGSWNCSGYAATLALFHGSFGRLVLLF